MICCGAVESSFTDGPPGGGTGKVNQSCYAFPGSGGLEHYYAYVQGHVVLATFEETEGQPLGLYAGFKSNFNLSGSTLVGTNFPSFFKFAKESFTWETGPDEPSGAQIHGTWGHNAPYPGPGKAFNWNWGDASDRDASDASLPTVGEDVNPADYGLKRIGDITMFNWNEETGDGYLYFLGGSPYAVQSKGYADSVKIEFQGTAPLHDYFPWAIKVSSGWRACNSQEHGHQSRHDNAWRDDKNRDGDTAGSTVFYYQDGSWKVAPRLE